MRADLAREVPKKRLHFVCWGAEGGAGRRTTSEGSRALGESFLSVAVGNFAALSLPGGQELVAIISGGLLKGSKARDRHCPISSV